MRRILIAKYIIYPSVILIFGGILSYGFKEREKSSKVMNSASIGEMLDGSNSVALNEKETNSPSDKNAVSSLPIFGHWRNFTTIIKESKK